MLEFGIGEDNLSTSLFLEKDKIIRMVCYTTRSLLILQTSDLFTLLLHKPDEDCLQR